MLILSLGRFPIPFPLENFGAERWSSNHVMNIYSLIDKNLIPGQEWTHDFQKKNIGYSTPFCPGKQSVPHVPVAWIIEWIISKSQTMAISHLWVSAGNHTFRCTTFCDTDQSTCALGCWEMHTELGHLVTKQRFHRVKQWSLFEFHVELIFIYLWR